jgi:hypothetical protein
MVLFVMLYSMRITELQTIQHDTKTLGLVILASVPLPLIAPPTLGTCGSGTKACYFWVSSI